MLVVAVRGGRANWSCPRCGKAGPTMLAAHAVKAARWHGFTHDPAW
jgi:ribosomal protein S27AE